MVSVKALACASVVASAVMFIMAFVTEDYYWVVPTSINIGFMLLMLHGDDMHIASRYVVWGSILPVVIQIAVSALYLCTTFMQDVTILHVDLYSYVSSFFLSASAFVSGLMFISRMERAGYGIVLTKRWVVLLAMLFSLAISVGSLFYEFVYLWAQGAPIFTVDVVSAEDRISNNMMMTMPLVASFSSALFALVTLRLLRGRDKVIMFEEAVE